MRIKKFFSVGSTTVTLLLALYFTFFLNSVLVKKLYMIISTSEGLGILFIASIPIFLSQPLRLFSHHS